MLPSNQEIGESSHSIIQSMVEEHVQLHVLLEQPLPPHSLEEALFPQAGVRIARNVKAQAAPYFLSPFPLISFSSRTIIARRPHISKFPSIRRATPNLYSYATPAKARLSNLEIVVSRVRVGSSEPEVLRSLERDPSCSSIEVSNHASVCTK
ncbi:hypothetical protein NL676_015725 [Syzygium grande]|nr:hypothetical protein NL676_015725 [Syzygium grande]